MLYRTIYRVECPIFEVGPYSIIDHSSNRGQITLSHKILWAHQSRKNHPDSRILMDQLKRKGTQDPKSGFISLKLLKKWFEGFIEPLESNGFVIRKYKVPRRFVLGDGKQIVFDPKRVRRGQELSWQEVK